MDNIQKLISDIEKTKKHYRSEHNNNYDGEKVCSQIRDLFAKTNKEFISLADAFAEHWFETYIKTSSDINSEPSQDNTIRLAALQSLLNGEPEDTEYLCDSDWKSLCEIVSAEAEDIPIDTLNSLMAIFLDKKAF